MLSSPRIKLMMVMLVFTLMLCLGSRTITAQILDEIKVPLSMDPVGSGARAIGMGSAFIAVADDATAASWNPAGLIQLETPEISVVGAYYQRTEKNTFGTNPEANGEQEFSNYNLNYLSAVYPFSLFKRNMIVSASHQYQYEMEQIYPASPSLSDSDSKKVETDEELDIPRSYGLGIAYRFSDNLTTSLDLYRIEWDDFMYRDEDGYDIRFHHLSLLNKSFHA